MEDYASAGAERWICGTGIIDDEGEFAARLEEVRAAYAEFAGV